MSISLRHTATCIFLMWDTALLLAQPDALTRDFEKLSAKERARIAKEEQVAAQNDAAYQAIMGEAEQLFRGAQYEASLEKYQAARTMRPYNVYPKVKIQDLQALIAKRDAAAATVMASAPEPVVTKSDGPVPPPSYMEPVRKVEPLVIGPAPVKAAPMVVELPAVRPAPIKPDTPKEFKSEPRPIVKRPASLPPDLTESERVYKEGRSVVVERRIAEEGRIVVYRKVSHPWGEVNYFRDGIAVSGRVYERATVGR